MLHQVASLPVRLGAQAARVPLDLQVTDGVFLEFVRPREGLHAQLARVAGFLVAVDLKDKKIRRF